MDKEDMYEVMKVTEEVERFSSHTDMSPPKKRRSKPHQTCSIEKPKKPRSAYLLYYFDVHQVMQQEVPNLPQSEINKRISESWRRLSVAEKSFYLEKAKLEKEGSYSPSPSPSKELPGFRKILPRTNYFVLAKGCTPGPEDSVPEVRKESLEGAAGAGLASVHVKVECPSSRPADVEQYPQTISVEEVAEETAAASHSETRRNPPYTSFTVLPNIESSPSAVSGPKVHEETPHIVALIPAQNLLTPSSLGSVTSVGSIMMMSKTEQSPKPSYNMPVKTYTRRGRGKCSNSQCSFVYVTRHKPPKCPDCGQYLGGKWIPVEKNAKSNKNKSSNANVGNQRKKPKAKNLVMKNSEAKVIDVQTSSSGKHLTQGGSSSSSTEKDLTKAKDDRTSQDKAVAQKKPVRPILPAYYNKNNAMFKIVTVPSHNEKITSSNATSPSVTQQTLTGLKPSTLKQLGQMPQANTDKQVAPADGSLNKKINIVSVVPFKQRTVTSFNLGLPTSRGRGWCKNPSCDFMYKNRHKPAVCPKCGLSLNPKDTKGIKSETLLDPCKPLTAAQKDLQRQSTLHLLQQSLQFAESEADLQETLSLIQELNSLQVILVQSSAEPEDDVQTETLFESGWPHFFESNATHCGLCSYPLFKGGQTTAAPQVDCWLLTETLMYRVSLQLKICLNVQCLALHSFTDIHSGLFNVGNRVLVSIDLFLKIRASIKLGLTPAQATDTLLNHVPNHSIHSLTPEEMGQIRELLQSGYWAFECLTVRDYNDMICGICGVAPKIEVSQRQNNLLSLKHVEFIWPESSHSDEVLVDDFWLTMESEALEQAVFPSDAPIIRVDASIIAPFIPPLMRSLTVINTEKNKVLTATETSPGNPSVLVRLIHDGHLRLDKLEEHSEEELRTILHKCGADITQEMTKDELMVSLLSLYTLVHTGLSTAPEPSPHFTAGKLSKVCPHKVVCGSKCLIRRETSRDHIDLLLSSRYWPPVYVSDCAQQVALCADMQYPDLATQMWGRNQGCFCDPFEKPEIVSCAELQDQPHSVDLDESHHIHPITRSVSRWLLHPPDDSRAENPPRAQHHSLLLCKDLEPYTELLSEFKTNRARQTEAMDSADATGATPDNAAVVFSNTAHYYLYNRLVDFLASRDIVNQQINQVLQSCQSGEVVIRDALYRLGVAKIDTQKEEEVIEDQSHVEVEVEVEPFVPPD